MINQVSSNTHCTSCSCVTFVPFLPGKESWLPLCGASSGSDSQHSRSNSPDSEVDIGCEDPVEKQDLMDQEFSPINPSCRS